MKPSYSFPSGDPIVAAAQRNDLVDMYTRLDGAPMSDILKMLETLAYYQYIDFQHRRELDPAKEKQHIAAIDAAPIFKDRMKLALVAVMMAGRMTVGKFQKEYEAYCNMVPLDQRQDVFGYVKSNPPQYDPIYGAPNSNIVNPLIVDGYYPLPWSLVTSSGWAFSRGILNLSGGYLYFQHMNSPDEIWQYWYSGVGLGKSKSSWSASVSQASWPSGHIALRGGIGRLWRMGSRAADVSSDSLDGFGSMISISASAAPLFFPQGGFAGSGGLTLLLLGAPTMMGYDDVDKVPKQANAIALLYGVSAGAGSDKFDAGISFNSVVVAPPKRVQLSTIEKTDPF